MNALLLEPTAELKPGLKKGTKLLVVELGDRTRQYVHPLEHYGVKVGDVVTLSKDIPDGVWDFGEDGYMLSVNLPNGEENGFFGYHFRVSQMAD